MILALEFDVEFGVVLASIKFKHNIEQIKKCFHIKRFIFFITFISCTPYRFNIIIVILS